MDDLAAIWHRWLPCIDEAVGETDHIFGVSHDLVHGAMPTRHQKSRLCPCHSPVPLTPSPLIPPASFPGRAQ